MLCLAPQCFSKNIISYQETKVEGFNIKIWISGNICQQFLYKLGENECGCSHLDRIHVMLIPVTSEKKEIGR